MPQPSSLSLVTWSGNFDPFGDQCEAQRLPMADDGSCQLTARIRIAQLGDERRGDLQDVQRQAPKVRERGVAGADVVDGHVDARSLQGVEGGDGSVEILEHRVLGDLEDQAGRIDVGPRQAPGDTIDEGSASELSGGHVDRHRQLRGGRERDLPAPQLLAGGAHHVLIDTFHEAAFHRHRQEVQGRDQSADRVLPADQGLGTKDLAGSQFHDRLVVEDELALAQRQLELLRQVRVG